MALFIFITVQLLLQVKSQGLPQANLTIFPTSATYGENVQMVCGGHEKHRVSECLAAMSSLPPITEDSPTTLTASGTTEANLSTASTMDTTTTSLAVTSSTEFITDPITNMTSLTTHGSQSSTGPANASLESSTVTETTEHTPDPEILKYLNKYLNKKMFFYISVVATGGGIVLTGLFGICLYGCTRRPKDERIWIERKSRKQGLLTSWFVGVPLTMAGSDSCLGEEDTAFYSTINSVQSTSQPQGNSAESKQSKMELNPLYYTILKQPPVSSDDKDDYGVVTVI
ncbi:uncharacterized protein [Chanodichthys erythropterus]|uniref:uncharacterized protein isoform X3 n=1 Tax=Chanodichthys erythropterus TaxID=933992 RepID=UPI00351E1735